MITADTAAEIWHCYREITAAEKLLEDIAEDLKNGPDTFKPRLRDAFGRRRNLQLGIPSGQDAHRLFDVAPSLAESIIRAHIANKKAELATANEKARIEIDSERMPPIPPKEQPQPER